MASVKLSLLCTAFLLSQVISSQVPLNGNFAVIGGPPEYSTSPNHHFHSSRNSPNGPYQTSLNRNENGGFETVYGPHPVDPPRRTGGNPMMPSQRFEPVYGTHPVDPPRRTGGNPMMPNQRFEPVYGPHPFDPPRQTGGNPMMPNPRFEPEYGHHPFDPPRQTGGNPMMPSQRFEPVYGTHPVDPPRRTGGNPMMPNQRFEPVYGPHPFDPLRQIGENPMMPNQRFEPVYGTHPVDPPRRTGGNPMMPNQRFEPVYGPHPFDPPRPIGGNPMMPNQRFEPVYGPHPVDPPRPIGGNPMMPNQRFEPVYGPHPVDPPRPIGGNPFMPNQRFEPIYGPHPVDPPRPIGGNPMMPNQRFEPVYGPHPVDPPRSQEQSRSHDRPFGEFNTDPTRLMGDERYIGETEYQLGNIIQRTNNDLDQCDERRFSNANETRKFIEAAAQNAQHFIHLESDASECRKGVQEGLKEKITSKTEAAFKCIDEAEEKAKKIRYEAREVANKEIEEMKNLHRTLAEKIRECSATKKQCPFERSDMNNSPTKFRIKMEEIVTKAQKSGITENDDVDKCQIMAQELATFIKEEKSKGEEECKEE